MFLSTIRQLWYEVLHSAYRNGHVPLLFSPTHPETIEQEGKPHWCSQIHWLILDCEDETVQRLQQRADWDTYRISEAVEDAHALRQAISQRIDTTRLSPDQVGHEVMKWVHACTPC